VPRSPLIFLALLVCACGPEPEVEAVETDGAFDCAEIEGDEILAPLPVGSLGFPVEHCSPRNNERGDYVCCSDDPNPAFSGANNDNGASGFCVRVEEQPFGVGAPEPLGCPVACDPTATDAEEDVTCGVDRECCQTRPLTSADCIQEEDGTWRPATGADLLEGRSPWSRTRPETAQDPTGSSCAQRAGAEAGDAFEACIRELTVANRRGYCLALEPGASCPHEAPGYLDACEQINEGLLPPPV
jgi:hypothetical protein